LVPVVEQPVSVRRVHGNPVRAALGYRHEVGRKKAEIRRRVALSDLAGIVRLVDRPVVVDHVLTRRGHSWTYEVRRRIAGIRQAGHPASAPRASVAFARVATAPAVEAVAGQIEAAVVALGEVGLALEVALAADAHPVRVRRDHLVAGGTSEPAMVDVFIRVEAAAATTGRPRSTSTHMRAATALSADASRRPGAAGAATAAAVREAGTRIDAGATAAGLAGRAGGAGSATTRATAA